MTGAMRVVWMLVAVLTAGVAGATSPGDGVHLFGRLNKVVVAIGEPFVYEVQAYALINGTEYARDFKAAFDAMSVGDVPESLLAIRMESSEVSVESLRSGQRVVRVTKRLVFRTAVEGLVGIPGITINWEGTPHRLAERSVTAYRTGDRFHKSAMAIVPVFVERTDLVRKKTYQRTGSGFFIRHDALVTSFHVVADARRLQVLLPDGSRVETGRVWSIDPIRDVAILHVDPERVRSAGVEPLRLAGDVTTVSERAPADLGVAFTYGWPGGVRRSTAGVSYRTARLGFDRAWISSNGVRPGDSGGPLLDASGDVVGVITLGTTGDSGPDVLQEDVCISNDPRPAIAQMSLALGTRSMKSVFRQPGFRDRPYVQAFRLLAMISRSERFDNSLRDALKSFESAVETRRADPGLHFMRGILYRMLGTEHEANASFSDVLEIFDGFFPASYLLGLDNLQRRRYADAAAHFERTRRVEPYQHLAEFGLARSLMGLHRYDEALELLERVLDYDPYFAPALYQAALCNLVRGEDADVTLASARLGHISRRWQRQLDHVVTNPVLWPRRVTELPAVDLSGERPVE